MVRLSLPDVDFIESNHYRKGLSGGDLWDQWSLSGPVCDVVMLVQLWRSLWGRPVRPVKPVWTRLWCGDVGPVVKVSLGETCETSEACLDPSAVCSDGHCSCQRGYTQQQDACGMCPVTGWQPTLGNASIFLIIIFFLSNYLRISSWKNVKIALAFSKQNNVITHEWLKPCTLNILRTQLNCIKFNLIHR